MKLIPLKRYEWHVSLTREEVMERIKSRVQPRYPLHFPYRFTDKPMLRPFEGEFQTDRFTISRVIGYRNSFMPLIEGQVVGTDSGSVVRMDMRLAKAVRVFLYIWFGFLSLLLCLLTFALIKGGPGDKIIALFPMILCVFGYALVHGAFKYENTRSIADLVKIFDNTTIQGAPRKQDQDRSCLCY